MRRSPVTAAFLVLLLAASWLTPASGCPFCCGLPLTFREEAAACELIVYGTLSCPRMQAGNGCTDVLIDRVLKSHPILGNKKVLTLPRHVSMDPNNPPRMLIFCDVHKGQIDPYRGVAAAPAVIDYLKGLLAPNVKDHARRLRHCFDFLDHADKEIAGDALREFVKTEDGDLVQAARNLPPAKLRVWLRDPKTPPDRLRTYGLLLGACGGAADAALLRVRAEKPAQKDQGLSDGFLIGCTLLDPKEGWTCIRQALTNPSSEFLTRYAGLRAVRFFWTTRPDIVAKKELLAAMSILLEQHDIADLAIEDLRRKRCWDLTASILPLYGKASHDQPINRRAVLRYALQCPGPAAAGFVAQRRIANPEWVAETEELLQLEAETK